MALSTVLDSLGIRKSWTLPESSNTERILSQSCQALPPHSHSPHSLQNTNHLHPSLISTSVNPDIKHTHTHTLTQSLSGLVKRYKLSYRYTYLALHFNALHMSPYSPSHLLVYSKSSPSLSVLISLLNQAVKKEICSYQ